MTMRSVYIDKPRSPWVGQMAWLLLSLGIAAPALPSRSAGQSEPKEALDNEFHIRWVAGIALAFHESTGRYPRALGELCSHGLHECGGPRPFDGALDAWGFPLLYEAQPGGFTIQSVGADGSLGTLDDLVYDSRQDRTQARHLAGCYAAVQRLEWLPPALSLDTTAGTIGSPSGGYRLRLSMPGHSDEAMWYPVDRDSVALYWVAYGVSVPSMRLEVDSVGGLRGAVRRPPDEAPLQVSYRRSECAK